MGRDKASVNLCNKPIITQVYEQARVLFDKTFIVSSYHDRFAGIDAPIIRDFLPFQSSLVGIVSALLYASTPYVFILACDMPFVTVESIGHVLDEIHGEEIIIPSSKHGFEPLHAVYNRSCIATLLSKIPRQHVKITRLLPYFSIRELEDHPAFNNRGISVFANINTEQDLSFAESFIDCHK